METELNIEMKTGEHGAIVWSVKIVVYFSIELGGTQFSVTQLHRCMGTDERCAQVRAIALQFQREVRHRVPSSAMLPRADRHTALLRNRFHKRQDTNLTSCPDRDSGDLPLCSCCCSFCPQQFRRNYLQSMGADDRPKGDGFQMQKRKGYMAGHVRKEELLAKAVTIDGRIKWYCDFCSDTNVWPRPECRRCKTAIKSLLQGKDMQAVSTRRRVVAAGLSRRPQAMVRIKCWPFEPSGQKRQHCVSCVTKTRDSRMKERSRPCSLKKQVKKLCVKKMRKWRRVVIWTVRKSRINVRAKYSSNCERSTNLQTCLRNLLFNGKKCGAKECMTLSSKCSSKTAMSTGGQREMNRS